MNASRTHHFADRRAEQAARHRAAFRRTHRPALVQTDSGGGETTGRSDAARARANPVLRDLRRAHRKIPLPDLHDARRDASLVCVVERAVDILSIEKSGTFRGKFHVLGGKISPLDGVEPEDLRIAELEKRLAQEPIREIIIALGTDVEGDATSYYLAKRLARQGLKISRIALRPARRQRTGIRRRTHLEPRAGRPQGNEREFGQ